MIGMAAAADRPAGKPAGQATGAEGTNAQVLACYFQGAVRCETCLKIEKQAREAIERRLLAEVAEKRLVFTPVDYDRPENARSLKDDELPCPSLVVVRQKGGQDQKWKRLGETWEHGENRLRFDEQVEGEVEKRLRDTK